MPSTQPKWFENVYAPLITAVIMAILTLAGQFFLQPLISGRTELETIRIRERREVYVTAGVLVNQLWGSIPWADKSGSALQGSTQPPSATEVNDTIMRLMLVSCNSTIPKTFADIFKRSQVPNALRSEERLTFFKMLREDLYGSEIADIDLMADLPLIIEKKKPQPAH